MKGIFLFLALFFSLCYSTDVYLTAYYTSSCGGSPNYAVLKLGLTSGSCYNGSVFGAILNADSSVSFYSFTNCSGNATFSVLTGNVCTNGTIHSYQSFTQMVPSGVYIQEDQYQDANCSLPYVPFNTFLPNGTNCVPAGTTPGSGSVSVIASPSPNATVTLTVYSKPSCTGSTTPLSLVPGCNPVPGNGYFNIGLKNLPVPITTTGSSVTGSSVTGSSVTGASVTGSSMTGSSVTGASVTGSSMTGSSVTGSSGSTTQSSSPSSDSTVLYPSLFLLVSLFLTFFF